MNGTLVLVVKPTWDCDGRLPMTALGCPEWVGSLASLSFAFFTHSVRFASGFRWHARRAEAVRLLTASKTGALLGMGTPQNLVPGLLRFKAGGN